MVRSWVSTVVQDAPKHRWNLPAVGDSGKTIRRTIQNTHPELNNSEFALVKTAIKTLLKQESKMIRQHGRTVDCCLD